MATIHRLLKDGFNHDALLRSRTLLDKIQQSDEGGTLLEAEVIGLYVSAAIRNGGDGTMVQVARTREERDEDEDLRHVRFRQPDRTTADLAARALRIHEDLLLPGDPRHLRSLLNLGRFSLLARRILVRSRRPIFRWSRTRSFESLGEHSPPGDLFRLVLRLADPESTAWAEAAAGLALEARRGDALHPTALENPDVDTETLLERALELQQSLNPTSWETAFTLADLGLYWRARRVARDSSVDPRSDLTAEELDASAARADRARDYFLRAIRVARQINPNCALVADALEEVADLERFGGDLDSAVQRMLEALSIWQEIKPERAAWTALQLAYIEQLPAPDVTGARRRQPEYALEWLDRREHLEHAIALTLSLTDDHPWRPRLQERLDSRLARFDDLGLYLDFLSRSIAELERTGESQGRLVKYLRTLGLLETRIGRLEEAAYHLDIAIHVARQWPRFVLIPELYVTTFRANGERVGDPFFNFAALLHERAAIDLQLGQFEQALALVQEYRDWWDDWARHVDFDGFGESATTAMSSDVLNTRAIALTGLGKWREANDTWALAAEHLPSQVTEANYPTLRVWYNQGLAAHLSGDAEKATQLLSRTVASSESMVGRVDSSLVPSFQPEQIGPLLGLAHHIAETGRLKEAFELVRRAAAASRGDSLGATYSLPEAEAIAWHQARRDVLDLAVTLAVTDSSLPRDWLWELLIESRAAVFEQTRARRKGLAPRPSATVHDILRLRPSGAGLVSFARYRHLALDCRNGERFGGVDRYVAFVVPPEERSLRLISLGPADVIDRAVKTWGQELAFASSSSIAERSYRSVANRLREHVWDPVRALIASAEKVFIVGDGSLQLVSFDSLPDGDGYLADSGPQFHSLGAERDLLRSQFALEPGGTALVVGNPAFGLDAGRDLPPLPSSGQEAREVERTWLDHSHDTAAVLLTDAAASEAALRSNIEGHRLLHLATHGFFDVNSTRAAGARGVGRARPAQKIVAVGGESRVPFETSVSWPNTQYRRSMAAFARPRAERQVLTAAAGSGLLLAGTSSELSSDDGVLTAAELAEFDLSQTRWAVLSACSTGTGDVVSGEGVFGLRRAFHLAGARTLVTSLWSVGDQATRDWMRVFYQHLLVDNLPTPAAVRATNREVLRQRRAAGRSTHPAYWGAFVSSGDWR